MTICKACHSSKWVRVRILNICLPEKEEMNSCEGSISRRELQDRIVCLTWTPLNEVQFVPKWQTLDNYLIPPSSAFSAYLCLLCPSYNNNNISPPPPEGGLRLQQRRWWWSTTVLVVLSWTRLGAGWPPRDMVQTLQYCYSHGRIGYPSLKLIESTRLEFLIFAVHYVHVLFFSLTWI